LALGESFGIKEYSELKVCAALDKICRQTRGFRVQSVSVERYGTKVQIKTPGTYITLAVGCSENGNGAKEEVEIYSFEGDAMKEHNDMKKLHSMMDKVFEVMRKYDNSVIYTNKIGEY
jgi:hypothetical protein